MRNRRVYSVDAEAVYEGSIMTLGDNIVDEQLVPEEFFIPKEEVARWEYEKTHALCLSQSILESLPNYMMLKPNIFNTYRNTVLGRVMGDKG